MKVAMLNFDLAWVKSVVLVLGNEVGGPHHMQGHHTWGPWTSLRKLVVLTFVYSSKILNRG